MPGEQVLHSAYMAKQPGLFWQIMCLGGLLTFLLTKAYYAVLTNRRLILIRTKQGFIRPKMVNVGVEQFDVAQIAKCTTSGLLNNRSMTFVFQNGTRHTLRIAPWVKYVSGNKAFFEQVPQLIGSPQLMAGAQAAGALPATGQPQMAQPAMAQPAMAQPALPAGFPPGARVLVAWSDGNHYPATVVQAQGEHYLCDMGNGQQQWIPALQLSPA